MMILLGIERDCAQGLPDLHSSIDMIFLPPAAYSFFKFYIYLWRVPQSLILKKNY